MAKPRLAGPPRRRVQPKHLIEGQARTSLVDRTAALLATATASKFEFEASCRHGLRTALVLNGHGWEPSDREAALIVTAALDKIGAVRPTWWQGQPEATYGPDHCLGCFGRLDPGDHVFCSAECASRVRRNREYRQNAETTYLSSHAYYLVTKHLSPVRQCVRCGTGFKAFAKDQVYCSHRCSSVARQDPELNKSCPICDRAFRAQRIEIETCSHSCAAELDRRRSPPKLCLECSAPFQGVKNAKFCSLKCRARHANRISYAKRKAQLN